MDDRSGDEVEILGEVYAAEYGVMVRWAYRRVGCWEEARDFVQECFVKALDAVARGLGWHTSVKAWLYRILQNLIIDRSRKRRHGAEMVDIDSLWSLAGEDPDPVEVVLANEAAEQVWAAVGLLKESHQRSLFHFYGAGRSNQEIAKMYGRSEGAERSMRFRARAALGELLEQELQL